MPQSATRPDFDPVSTLKQLGLHLRDSAFRDGATLYRDALGALNQWQERLRATRGRLLQAEEPLLQEGPVWRKAGELITEAHRAGLRAWVNFAPTVPLLPRLAPRLP